MTQRSSMVIATLHNITKSTIREKSMQPRIRKKCTVAVTHELRIRARKAAFLF